MVQVVQSGKTKDPYLAVCIWNIWLLTATHDINLVVQHIMGIDNVITDCLSRLYSDKHTDPDPSGTNPTRGSSPRIDIGLEELGYFHCLDLDPLELDPVKGRSLRMDVGLDNMWVAFVSWPGPSWN